MTINIFVGDRMMGQRVREGIEKGSTYAPGVERAKLAWGPPAWQRVVVGHDAHTRDHHLTSVKVWSTRDIIT